MLPRDSTIAVCLAVALLTGCGVSPDLSEGVSKLKTGDAEQRVVELCGQPNRKSNSANGEEWYYETTVMDDAGAKARLKVTILINDGTVRAIRKSRSPIK